MPHYKVVVQLYRTFTFETATADEARKLAENAMKETNEVFNINQPKDLDLAKKKKEEYLKKRSLKK